MDKKEIIKLIDDSIIIEEMAIPIYKKHLDSSMFWSGFDVSDQETIRQGLETLIRESKKHIKILNRLSELAQGEK